MTTSRRLHGDRAWAEIPTLAAGTRTDKQLAAIVAAIKIAKVAVKHRHQVTQWLIGPFTGVENVDDIRWLVCLCVGKVDASRVKPCANGDRTQHRRGER